MIVKDLINKLIDLNSSNCEIGIAIIKQEGDDTIFYIGAKDTIYFDVPMQIGDNPIIWMQAKIEDKSKVIKINSVKSPTNEVENKN